MRFVPTRIHGLMDYPYALILAASPWLFQFTGGGVATWLPVILGVSLGVMALVTDFEPSLARLVPMPVHLGADALAGGLLAASPLLFGFSDRVRWPHVIFGLLTLGLAFVTSTHPRHGRAARALA